MPASAVIPAAGAIGGAAISSRGAKKAAKSARPQIPREFRNAASMGANLLTSRLRTGFPAFGGQRVAPLSDLEQRATFASENLLRGGEGGLQSSIDTIRQFAESGIDPSTIQFVQDQLAPLLGQSKDRLVAGSREASAQGGRFFSRGGVQQETDVLADLEARFRAEVLQNSLGISQFQLGAAEAFPRALAQSFGAPGAAAQIGGIGRGVEQGGLDAAFQEFLRIQPENAIPLLAQLMGSTPFAFNPQAPNFGQVAGGQISNLFTNPNFLNFLTGLGSPGGEGTQTGSGSVIGTGPS